MTRDDEIKLKVATITDEAVGEKKKSGRRLLIWAGSACAAILIASIAFVLYLNNSPPNATILLSPLTTQEAVLSSRIAGTQATMTEVLEFEADESAIDDPTGKKRGDIKEVVNYRRAIHQALELLETLPLSQRIIKEAHLSTTNTFVVIETLFG